MNLKNVGEISENHVQYVLERYESARELQKGVVDNNLFANHMKREEILHQIENDVRIERLYGADFTECIRNIMRIISD
ncbi:MAG: hypothetical protein R3Y58_14290 [Eubacteriales bacterium]